LAVLADRLDLEELLEDLTEVAVAFSWLATSLPGVG
jgi:hypothetical protein